MKFLKGLNNYRLLLILIACIFASDQLTKWIVIQNIPYGTYHNPISVIPGFLYWVHIGNKGAAWGLLEGAGTFLATIAIATIALVIVFRKSLHLQQLPMQVTFGLLIGGILGNLYDRLVIGHVTDFIDVHLPFYRWPAFNIADSAICVAVFFYFILSFRGKKTVPETNSSVKSEC